jgi:hypothetical protein
VAFTVAGLARWVGIDPSNVVLICEYTGGGFGSKGAGAVSMAIPALLSKKANAPVMMRISREEESYIGRARPTAGRGRRLRKDGRLPRRPLHRQDNGPADGRPSAAGIGSLAINRWPCGSAVNVLTTRHRAPSPLDDAAADHGTGAAKAAAGSDRSGRHHRVNSPEAGPVRAP